MKSETKVCRISEARRSKKIDFEKIKRFARRGYSNNEIYKTIGIDKKTWRKWSADPKVKKILIEIRECLPDDELKSNGRPTEYETRYCEMIFEYFNIKPYETREKIIKFKNGCIIKTEEYIPNDLPLFSKFASRIGVHRQTLRNWAKSHEDFDYTYKICLDMQQNILITNGLRGLYNPSYAGLVSKNFLNMRDKKDITLNNHSVKPVTYILPVKSDEVRVVN